MAGWWAPEQQQQQKGDCMQPVSSLPLRSRLCCWIGRHCWQVPALVETSCHFQHSAAVTSDSTSWSMTRHCAQQHIRCRGPTPESRQVSALRIMSRAQGPQARRAETSTVAQAIAQLTARLASDTVAAGIDQGCAEAPETSADQRHGIRPTDATPRPIARAGRQALVFPDVS